MPLHRLARAEDLLSPELIRLGGRVLVFEAIGSTNAELLSRAAQLGDGTLAWAESQNAGRGRQGRRWVAPKGSSALLSVLLHEPAGSPLIKNASLLACLAACEAIEETTDCRPGIRWPNDLTIGSRKLAGLLVESTPIEGCASAGRALIVGVGINCLQQRGHFAAELADKATSLEIESLTPVDRLCVAAALVRRLDALFSASMRATDRIDGVRRRWLDRCTDRGQWVRMTRDGQSFEGVVLDIDAEGNLLVHLNTGARVSFEAATTTRCW